MSPLIPTTNENMSLRIIFMGCWFGSLQQHAAVATSHDEEVARSSDS